MPATRSRATSFAQYVQLMAPPLAAVEAVVADWLPAQLPERLPARLGRDVQLWWKGLQDATPTPLTPLHRLTLCYALARSGAFPNVFRNCLSYAQGGALSLATPCPLEQFSSLAARNRAVCDLRLFHAFYGLGSLAELRLAFLHVLRRSLARQLDPWEGPPNAPEQYPAPLVPVCIAPGQGPALFHYMPSRCDWVLLHVFDQQPTVSLLAFASDNRWLRTGQLPSPEELTALREVAAKRFGVASGAGVGINHVLMPVDHLDQPSMAQVRRLVGEFIPSVEQAWEQYTVAPAPDVDLSVWQRRDDPHAWLTRK